MKKMTIVLVLALIALSGVALGQGVAADRASAEFLGTHRGEARDNALRSRDGQDLLEAIREADTLDVADVRVLRNAANLARREGTGDLGRADTELAASTGSRRANNDWVAYYGTREEFDAWAIDADGAVRSPSASRIANIAARRLDATADELREEMLGVGVLDEMITSPKSEGFGIPRYTNWLLRQYLPTLDTAERIDVLRNEIAAVLVRPDSDARTAALREMRGHLRVLEELVEADITPVDDARLPDYSGRTAFSETLAFAEIPGWTGALAQLGSTEVPPVSRWTAAGLAEDRDERLTLAIEAAARRERLQAVRAERRQAR